MPDHLQRLQSIVERHARPGRFPSAIPRVQLGMILEPTAPAPVLFQPMMCFVLRGAKEVTIGNRRLRYDPASYFIATLDLPASGCILRASRSEPYLSATLMLDRRTLAELIVDVPAPDTESSASFGTSPITPDLLDAWLRLLQLLDAPNDIAVLAPLIEREILYRLLAGPQGHVLRQVVSSDARLARVHQAVNWIRSHFDEPMRIDRLARIAGMSAASFHRHFKAVTAMSPLQYQKLLRLQQARRLLVANEDAARAGYAVGYESASQFSREYARLFGAPPARDALRLQQMGTGSGDAAATA
jgi:AraC-like DNA-binding protein